MNKIKEQIIERLIEHSRVLYSIISDLGVYYTAWAEDYESNRDNLKKKRIKMQMSEEEGDTIKIDLIKNFAEVGRISAISDYIALILRMDNIINNALEFVDILTHIDFSVNDEIKQRYHKLINKIIEMVDVFKKTIKSMRDNPKETFDYTTEVHEIENSIDLLYREFLNFLYDYSELDIRKLLRIKDSIDVLEELADRIHDVTDVVRVLLYQ